MIPARNVVIHGAGGAIGGAVAAEFARRGARLFLAGRRLTSVESTAKRLRGISDVPIQVTEVNAGDAVAVAGHASHVAATAGGIDVVFNAVSIPLEQGVPLLDMTVDEVVDPAKHWLRTQFLTSQAAARHMVPQGSGTILTLSASPARVAIAGVGGFAAACAAVEALTRTLAAEVGPAGVRAVCIRPQRIADTIEGTSDLPLAVEEFRHFLESLTTSHTLPTLADVGRAAVFLAEGGAESMNGAVMNLTCGMSGD